MIPAVAIEMIHTFSLIHDDLPAMDNDDFRRGRPTNHKVYGEAMAILAGDALLAFAFELIAKHYPGSPDRAVAIIRELAEATGPGGMTGGQVLDMTFGENGKDLNQVEQIHLLKTAALIRGACRMGAISAGATDETIKPVTEYGLKLGLAFQVIDDYLDQTASASDLGKKAGKDAAGNKPNYALHAGSPQKAWDRACQLVQEAKDSLKPFGPANEKLLGLADIVLNRKS
jgi:geranylgeranyl diphosphate synthase type II